MRDIAAADLAARLEAPLPQTQHTQCGYRRCRVPTSSFPDGAAIRIDMSAMLERVRTRRWNSPETA